MARYWKIFLAVIYGMLFLKLVHAAISIHTDDCWRIADWLINYQGGFVRRGFIGELIFKLTSVFKTDISVVVKVIQVSLYAIIMFNAYRLSVRVKPTPANMALLLSPAFLFFPALDPYGGYRKEIMFLALLSFLCSHTASTKSKAPSNGIYLLVLLASLVIVLSHEMLLAYLPYLVAVFLMSAFANPRHEARKAAFVLVPSVLAAIIVVFFFKGNAKIVRDICDALDQGAPADCENFGAINFLEKDMQYGYEVVRAINSVSTVVVYAIALLLAATPLAVFYHRAKTALGENKKALVGLCGLALAVSIPLVFVVADYGRLIYIHIACLSFLALQILNIKPELDLAPVRSSKWIWCVLTVFLLSWKLTHSGASITSLFWPLKVGEVMVQRFHRA